MVERNLRIVISPIIPELLRVRDTQEVSTAAGQGILTTLPRYVRLV